MNAKPASCLVCLKNTYNDNNLILFDLFTQEWDNLTHLNKLQNVLNDDMTVYDQTLICSCCLDDLNKAFEFKEKVLRALEYWSSKFGENVPIQDKTSEEDPIDIKSNDEVNESNIYTEDSEGNDVEVKNKSVETVIKNIVEEDVECSKFSCSKCTTVFEAASELEEHNCFNQPRTAKKENSDRYKCTHCDLTFSNTRILNKHLEKHSPDKKFSCSYCGQNFKKSYHLREHLTGHTGERNFSCELCGKTFLRLSSQKRHMRSCSAPPGQKAKKSPFLCTICGKNFPYSNGAQRHMRIHTGDKRYSCEVCGRKFNQSTHLKVHLRTHTGERPYMCNICGETFSLKASLHKHINGHSGKKNNMKIFQNLEPNLSQTHDGDDEKDFVIDDASPRVFDCF